MGDRPVAFITGASRGIGKGVALELAKAGYDIVGNATSLEGLDDVKKQVQDLGASFEPAPGDIGSIKIHNTLLSRALDRFGGVNLLVNNAGIAPRERKDILETTPKSYDEVFAINTRAPFFLSQLFANQMIKQDKPGQIIFITSISSYMASQSRAEYCMSKAATSMCAKVLAHKLAKNNINVYEIRPGITKTDMTQAVAEKYDPLIREGLVPQRRWAFPEDVGKAAASLARGDFSFSTGQVFEISGGMQIQHL